MDSVQDNLKDNIQQDPKEPEVPNHETASEAEVEAVNEERTQYGRFNTRERVPTLKGKQYQQELAERDFKNSLRSWKGQISKLKSIIVVTLDKAVLQQERGKLEARLEDLSNAHFKAMDVFQSEEYGQDLLTAQYEDANIQGQEMFKRLDSKMTELLLKDIDCKSLVSSHSRRSRKSEVSLFSRSSRSSVFKRTEMVAKAARLQAELKFHEVETEGEAKLQKHKDEIKKLKMIKELAVTNAEIQAVDRVEETEYGVIRLEDRKLPVDNGGDDRLEKYLQSQMSLVVSDPIDEQSNNAKHVPPSITVYKEVNSNTSDDNRVPMHSRPSESISEAASEPTGFIPFKLNPSATSYHGDVKLPTNINPQDRLYQTPREVVDNNVNSSEMKQFTTSSNEDVLKNLADLLTRRQDRESLPRPEPEVFNGNYLQYPNWLKSFENFIVRKTKDPSERLYYLNRYTSGEAKEAVSVPFPVEYCRSLYAKAKKILANRFGNPFLVTDAYRKRINDWPKILPNDCPSLRKFSKRC